MARAAVAAWLVLCGLSGAAAAQPAETYSYTIHHPTFGDIGTYTDRVERNGGDMRVETRLQVVVRALGVVLHREEAERSEIWRAGRLVAFHALNTINGERVTIEGAAREGGFTVATAGGSAPAPADVVPSDPWQVGRSRAAPSTGTMMSTRDGRIEPMQVTGGESLRLAVHGLEVPVRHYEINSHNRQDVWLDARGIPIAFRTVERGTPIDFVLAREMVAQLAALPE